jgi:hypothetical protein
MALLFLVVSPIVVCFWTVLVNRYCNIKDDPDSEVLSKRAVRFVGAFLLGFIMPIVAEVCYISLSSRMTHVDNRVIWFLWFAGLDLAAFSPIILLLARRSSSWRKWRRGVEDREFRALYIECGGKNAEGNSRPHGTS